MKLTIGIPTFNRDDELISLVSRIRESIISSNLQSQTQILISSNGMKNETFFHLKQLDKDLNIRIILNDKNLGYDLNVLKIIHSAESHYLLLMSDDDLISDNLLESIIFVIDHQIYEHLIICNQYLYVSNFQELVGQEQFFKDLEKDKSYRFDDFRLNSEFFGGISGLVLPVDKTKALNLSKFIGTNWIQLAISFELIRSVPLLIPSKGFVLYRLDNPNRTWKVLTNNISIRYIYKSFFDLNYSFIGFGFSKYDGAVRSDMFNCDEPIRINSGYYFKGLNLKNSKNSLEAVLLYLLYSVRGIFLRSKMYISNNFNLIKKA